MTDLLQSILDDPELQQWPRRAHNSGADLHTEILTADTAESVAGTDSSSGAHDDYQAALNKLMPLVTPAGTDDADSDAGALTAATPQGVDSENPQTRIEPPADADDDAAQLPAADDSVTAPLAFDDIAAHTNPLTRGITGAGEWLKNRDWKNPKTLATAAAVIIGTAAAGFWWAGSAAHDTAAPTAQITRQGSADTPAPPPPAAPAADVSIPPESVTDATARCPAPSSDPRNALRPDSTQPWICVRAWGIDGQLLQLTFDRPYVITEVRIVPGADTEADGQDQWVKYRTVTRASWTFNDAAQTTCRQDTQDRRELLPLPVGPATCESHGPWPPVASALTLTIEKTSEPSNPGSLETPAAGLGADYSAFAVSRIEIVGHPAG